MIFSKSGMTTQLTDINRVVPTDAGLRTSWLSIEDSSLVVVEGPHTGLEFRLDQEIVRIGRAEWCDIILANDSRVSSVHCECWLDRRGVRIRDLESRNGTLLNECPVFDAYVIEGANIRIGNSILQLKSHRQRKEIEISYQDESGLLVGKSPSMRKIFTMLSRLGQRDVVTLLTGETGTGKTSIAEAIHKQSKRSENPFVTVNCGALPASLIEATLFGYEKGAFTGATSKHQGVFQQAHTGTLFLDEIAELPIELQPKLLDILERKKVRPINSEQEIDVDFRLITATHQNLKKAIQEGRFREDLYFRLSVVELDVPPLRERREDIPLLVDKLLKSISPDLTFTLTDAAIRSLESYLWPGNIRELRNLLERAIVFLEGQVIDVENLGLSSTRREASGPTGDYAHSKSRNVEAMAEEERLSGGSTLPLTTHCTVVSEDNLSVQLAKTLCESPVLLKELTSSFEKAILSQALNETGMNAQKASELLGISPAWLYNRVKKYDLKTRRSGQG